MENIIQQVATEFTTQLVQMMIEGICDLGQVADAMMHFAKAGISRMLATYVMVMDQQLCDAKAQRKLDGFLIHERNVPRSFLTQAGSIQYQRTYFEDRNTHEKVYLLDHVIGVEKNERICAQISAQLVNASVDLSYERSTQAVTQGAVSKQTVKNKINQTNELAFIPPKAQETPDTLHIFADEDHVHLQNGKSTMVPLVVVTEGTEPVCAGRNALKEPLYFQGLRQDPDDLWQYVYANLAVKYHIEDIKKIYLHGDGANWIKMGLEYLPNSEYVLDAYHFLAHMKGLTGTTIGKPYSREVNAAVRTGSKASFHELVEKIAQETFSAYPDKEAPKKATHVREIGTYIENHWEAIQNIHLPDMVGSCTEPLVSHVLSERLSRNPMGWSMAGLEKMAALRVYSHNGMSVLAEDMRHNPQCSVPPVLGKIAAYEQLVKDQQREIFASMNDWSLFEQDSPLSAKLSGTQIALDALVRLRPVA